MTYKQFRESGWRRDLEDFRALHNMCLPAEVLRRLRTMDFEPPAEIDPRGWHQVENQQQMGSCQGHALSSCMEYCYKIATGDVTLQLSRMYAYIRSQLIDNIRGDNGSTIAGGARCAREYGLCLETTWPYTGRYTQDIPDGCDDEAKKYQLRTAVECRTYDDVYQFISQGLGGVEIGIQWNGSCEPRGGIIADWQPARSGGGHALAFLGYDEDGNLWMANSWGKQWGDGGYARVTRRSVENMLRHSWTVMIGLSDMKIPLPRKPRIKI